MAKEALNQGEIETLLNELETKMNRLRTVYEQYFMGIERTPPTTLRKEVFRIVQRMENVYIRNTAQKFRLRSLVQRFNSYKSYWGRVERQIEEGTYQRDINRANRRQMRQRPQAEENDLPVLELDLEMEVDLEEIQAEMDELDAAGAFDSHVKRSPREPQMPKPAEMSDEEKEAIKRRKLAELRAQLMGGDGDAPASAPVPTPAPQRAQPQAEPAEEMDERAAKLARLKSRLGTQNRAQTVQQSTPPSGPHRVIERPTQRVIERPSSDPSEDKAKRVYNELIETKKKLNESTAGLSYETVKKSIDAQTQQLKESRGAKDVDFKVVVKDGKAFLKPQTK